MPLAYLDTPSGISGDIFLGCLVDAGWPLASLRAAVEALDLPAGSWNVRAEEVSRRGLRATCVHVDVRADRHSRRLSDIQPIIRAAELPPQPLARALAVFARLAAAEARIHDTTPAEVHFHEVGGLDAVIDIVGVCVGMHELGIDRLFSSPLPLGSGWTDSMHGRIPLPAPATLDLLAAVAAPTVPAPGPGELVTPTGAALLAELAEFRQPDLSLRAIGYGAGHKDFAWPNVARLWLGQPASPEHADTRLPARDPLTVIETNIDDMTPELYQPVQRLLFESGALDVWTTPIGMKKGRPGTMLSVLAPRAAESTIAALLLRQTTTLGVRVHPVERHVADRAMQTIDTPYGRVRVKLKRLGGSVIGAKPEFEDCRRLAEATGAPLPVVFAAAQAAALPLLDPPPPRP